MLFVIQNVVKLSRCHIPNTQRIQSFFFYLVHEDIKCLYLTSLVKVIDDITGWWLIAVLAGINVGTEHGYVPEK